VVFLQIIKDRYLNKYGNFCLARYSTVRNNLCRILGQLKFAKYVYNVLVKCNFEDVSHRKSRSLTSMSFDEELAKLEK
jgi:hypothetical protein